MTGVGSKTKGIFARQRLDPVGQRVAAAGIAQRVARGEYPVACLEERPPAMSAAQSALRARPRDEGAFGVRADQHDAIAAVHHRRRAASVLDAFRRESGAQKIAIRSDAVLPGEDDRHARPARGDHHVEAAAGDTGRKWTAVFSAPGSGSVSMR